MTSETLNCGSSRAKRQVVGFAFLAWIILGAHDALASSPLSDSNASSTSSLAPENVVVLYNDEPGGPGGEIANYYQQLRPGVHLLPISGLDSVLSGGTNEDISAEDYLSVILPQVRQGIDNLESGGSSIDVIVTTKGMPLRINTNPGEVLLPNTEDYCSSTTRQYSSLESELTRIDSFDLSASTPPTQEWVANSVEQMRSQVIWSGFHQLDENFSSNPYYDTNGPFVRDGSDSVNGDIHLTARLDGFSVEAVKNSLDRSQSVTVGSPSAGHYFVVDDDPTAGADQMVDVNPGGPGDGLRVVLENQQRMQVYENSDEAITNLTNPETGSELGETIGYVSHGVKDGPGGLGSGYVTNQLEFSLADGAIFLTHESFNARSFDSNTNQYQGLTAEWIERGGAAALGHVEEPCNGPDGITNEDLLFQMMLPASPDQAGSTGLTYVEAAWNATRQLSSVNTVIGDPLMVWQTWLPGDINFDGELTESDVNLFVMALVNRAAFDELGIGVDPEVVGDVNGSGRFDFGDINAFKALFPSTDPLLGDLNNDGMVSHADVNPLVQALTNRTAYHAANYGVDPNIVGDIDENGSFNLGDIKFFIQLVSPDDGPLIGDMNGDGLIGPEDAEAFILALTDASAYADQYPLLDREIAGDINEDGLFNFGDISSFKTLLANAGFASSATSVPEPGTAVLLALAAILCLLPSRCDRFGRTILA